MFRPGSARLSSSLPCMAATRFSKGAVPKLVSVAGTDSGMILLRSRVAREVLFRVKACRRIPWAFVDGQREAHDHDCQ